jgi:hypothetical protein
LKLTISGYTRAEFHEQQGQFQEAAEQQLIARQLAQAADRCEQVSDWAKTAESLRAPEGLGWAASG